jgi:hypothetical protein
MGSHLLFSHKTAGWGRKCETERYHGEAARFVLAKVRSDAFARFHAVAAKRLSRTPEFSLTCWNRCFALQLLYRWRHQSGIFWILPRPQKKPQEKRSEIQKTEHSKYPVLKLLFSPNCSTHEKPEFQPCISAKISLCTLVHFVMQHQPYRKHRRRAGGLNAEGIKGEPASIFKTVVQNRHRQSLIY